MIAFISFAREILDDLPIEERCPYLAVTDRDIYCNKDFNGKITDKRRVVCSSASIQLFCGDANHANCIWYKGLEKFAV